MSDNPDTLALSALRIKLRELELMACDIKARVEEVRECIALLEGPRRGRPRKIVNINPERPDRVAGGMQETPVEEVA